MKLKIHYPSDNLSDIVEYYWQLESSEGEDTSFDRLLVPDGRLGIIFPLKDPIKMRRRTITTLENHGFVCGQFLGPLQLSPMNTIDMFGVQLTAQGASSLFVIPLSEFTDHVLSLDHVWGTGTNELFEQVMAANTVFQRIEVLRFVLHQKTTRSNPDRRVVIKAANLIVDSPNQPVDTIARTLGIGERRLLRLFNKHIGVSPKRYARIFRMHSLLISTQQSSYDSWAGHAVDHGFYDQSHMIQEFIELTGSSPERFQNEYSRLYGHYALNSSLSENYNTELEIVS